jgi:heme-degrading monooxygenase HmoA
LSGWRDEKALVRWRTKAVHHGVQEKGRQGILADYHLRVGEIFDDTRVPKGQRLINERLDETQVGEGTTITLLSGTFSTDYSTDRSPEEVASELGLQEGADGLLEWDVYDAVLTPGELILMLSWKDRAAAEAFRAGLAKSDDIRVRQIRVIRDYAKYDRREAPQYYPDAGGRETIHD